MDIALYNTLTRSKDKFVPIDPDHIQVYACGPTVYDHIHIGNARALIVFDVLVKLLRELYPKVSYVRNITDIDDKINARAAERQISIGALCQETISHFHHDAARLLVSAPDQEPRATHHIAQMIEMITKIINNGFAYEASGHVLFCVKKRSDYGHLSRRSLGQMRAGARVEIAPYKKDAADFILWKPSDSKSEPGWKSPWGYGRPGWHIECSAMSAKYFGPVFDIHAGGHDLIFPHHENEIAQSCSAHNNTKMANYWMHNGFVMVNSEKMSKSLGNFTTVKQALAHYKGETLRYSLLSSHYRAPLDYSDHVAKSSETILAKFYRAAELAKLQPPIEGLDQLDKAFIDALCDDLNTPLAMARLHQLAGAANKGEVAAASQLVACAKLLGLLQDENWFKSAGDGPELSVEEIELMVIERDKARALHNFTLADEIRYQLATQGVRLYDLAGETRWERS